MEKDKVAAKAAFDALPTSKKIGHIWEYYRLQIILGIAVTLAAFSLIYGCVTRVHPDLTVILLTRAHIADETADALEEWIAPHIQDANGDGRTAVNVMPISFDLLVPNETVIPLLAQLDGQLTAGDVKLIIADELFAEWFNARNGNLIERYAEVINNPPMIEGLAPLFVIERIEYERHMSGRRGERKEIEHANARTIFHLLAE